MDIPGTSITSILTQTEEIPGVSSADVSTQVDCDLKSQKEEKMEEELENLNKEQDDLLVLLADQDKKIDAFKAKCTCGACPPDSIADSSISSFCSATSTRTPKRKRVASPESSPPGRDDETLVK